MNHYSLSDKNIHLLEEVPPRTFTPEELAQYDGEDERPAYVAVDGVVYDVTNLPIWRRGRHFGMRAGNNLSENYHTCHENFPTIQDLQPVGILVTDSASLHDSCSTADRR